MIRTIELFLILQAGTDGEKKKKSRRGGSSVPKKKAAPPEVKVFAY